MHVQSCPDAATLQRLLDGTIAIAEAESLEEHLLGCEKCLAAVRALPTDNELISAIRTRNEFADDDSALAKAIEQAKQLRSGSETVETDETLAAQTADWNDKASSQHGIDEEIDFLASPESPDEIGRLGNYRVLEVLGIGGMGVVFRAEDPQLKRHVALKAMKPVVAASRSAKDRFIREAQATAAIEHDNIVHIYQVDQDRGVPFIAMQFLRGESLQKRLDREQKVSPREAVRIAREVAAGLSAAHEHGLIHRDIKPDNVWLEGKTGRAKILDFGLVRSAKDDAGLTQSGMVLGTPKYMAPEQARGIEVDQRSDLFSLGSVLYRLVSGRAPFTGGNLTATLLAVSQGECRPIQEVCPELDPQLAKYIMQLLSADPEARPQTAADVVAALRPLEQIVDDEASTPSADLLGRADTNNAQQDASPPHRGGKNSTRGDSGGHQPQPVTSTSWNGIAKTFAVLALLLTVPSLAYLAVATIFKVETETGTVTIQIEGEAKSLSVDVSQDKTITLTDPNDGKEIKVTVDRNQKLLQLQKVGFKLATTSFTLQSRDGNQRVTVSFDPLEKSSPSVVRNASEKGSGTENTNHRGKSWALEFDGRQTFVNVPSLRPRNSGPLTLEAWVTPRAGGDKHGTLFRFRGANYVKLQFNESKKRWEFDVRSSAKPSTLIHSNEIADWQTRTHVAFMYDKGEMALFVDGKKCAEASVDPEYVLPGHLEIAGLNPIGRSGFGFRGTIDEIRVSNSTRYTGDFTPQQRFDADADTLALYQFDEGSGDELRDSSGNGHHGKIVGAKWGKVDDQLNVIEKPPQDFALQFDGNDDSVELPTLKYDGTHPLTIEAFVHPQELNEQTSYNNVVVTTAQGVLGLRQIRGKWRAETLREGGKQRHFARRDSETAPTEQLAHVVVQYDGETISMFVDGKRQATELTRFSDADGPATNSTPVDLRQRRQPVDGSAFIAATAVATAANRPGQFLNFRGIIDEVRFSRIARYTKDFTPVDRFESDEHTLALYHFDSGQGDRLIDASGNGHHGKIHGAKWVRVDASLNVTPPFASAPPLAVAPFDADEAKQHQKAWADYLGVPVEQEIVVGKDKAGKEVKLAMVLIPPGEFMMGSTADEQARCLEEANAGGDESRIGGTPRKWVLEKIPTEGPQHRVRITQPFYLGKYEVTQSQWQAVTGDNPSKFSENPSHPVEMVRWDEMQSFVEILNSDGDTAEMTFALPTEAQWEYACRAGTETPYPSGDGEKNLSEYAWFEANSDSTTHAVGQLNPNGFGLHDMLGNVQEWCGDMFTTDYYAKSPVNDPPGPSTLAANPAALRRISRGGSWSEHPSLCRSAFRTAFIRTQGHRNDHLGFRLAASIEAVKQAPPAAVAPFNADEAKRHQQTWADYLGVPVEKEIVVGKGDDGRDVLLTMVLIPPGEFMMGSTDDERAKLLAKTSAKNRLVVDRILSEGPQHRVRISNPLYLGKFEVTQAQWKSVIGANPSHFKDDSACPVEQISWEDVQLFLTRINESDADNQVMFALPSEAQWEYACRAGSVERYFGGETEDDLQTYGWFEKNSKDQTHRVGKLRANAFGLHDMHGNVWEWCSDWFAVDYYAKAPTDDPTGPTAGSSRVSRGGCWYFSSKDCRSAGRAHGPPDRRHYNLGFRLAASIDITKQPSPLTVARLTLDESNQNQRSRAEYLDQSSKAKLSKTEREMLRSILKAIVLVDVSKTSIVVDLQQFTNEPVAKRWTAIHAKAEKDFSRLRNAMQQLDALESDFVVDELNAYRDLRLSLDEKARIYQSLLERDYEDAKNDIVTLKKFTAEYESLITSIRKHESTMQQYLANE